MCISDSDSDSGSDSASGSDSGSGSKSASGSRSMSVSVDFPLGIFGFPNGKSSSEHFFACDFFLFLSIDRALDRLLNSALSATASTTLLFHASGLISPRFAQVSRHLK